MATPYRDQTEQAQPAARIDWTARLAVAEAKRDAAKATLSTEDKEEIAFRKREAEIEAERLAAEAEARALDLARRLDAMREFFGDGELVDTVSIEKRPDTFIIKCDSKAHEKWERDSAKSATNSKISTTDVKIEYAVAVVVDWNGQTDFGPTSTHGFALRKHLQENPGIATSIVNAAARLAGLFAEERKS